MISNFTTWQKIGIILLVASLIFIAAVIYTGYENLSPKGKDLGEVMICWHIPEYDELVSNSDLIVVATVTNKTGIWWSGPNDTPAPLFFRSRSIFTVYSFKPDEVLKGNTTTIFGRVHGGTVDGYTQKATPTPSFEVGDQVLLFLRNNQDVKGNPILWYYVDWPSAFTSSGDGIFENEVYGEVSIEELKREIAGV
ncbi:MAG: hypothetical protein LBE57_01485 [Methanosarcinales archaeon]|jgi:hypothetical protein|nr:hypothetical protein [Methanosarcinales archaeon]